MVKRIIVISGFSGAGKGSSIKRLFEMEQITPFDSNLWLSVSDTTRQPRNDDVDNYNFICMDEYKKRILSNYYLEYNEYGNNGYGTPLKSVLESMEHGNTVVLEIDYNGMIQVQEYFSDSDVSVETVFICIEANELFDRLCKRGDAPAEIKKRLLAACSEASHICEYDYKINNHTLEETACTLQKIVAGKMNCERGEFDSFRFCHQATLILDTLK